MKAWQYREIPFPTRVAMHVTKHESGCHLFTGRKDSHGYGQIKDKGRAVLVHRWIWQQKHGHIDRSTVICHRCDVPACVNIEHLFSGTTADNVADMIAKGRDKNRPRGVSHKRPHAKVTSEKVAEMKLLLRRGVRQCDIANTFGVSRNLISEIKLGKTWRHVT